MYVNDFTGLLIGAVVLILSITGLMLLIKLRFYFINPTFKQVLTAIEPYIYRAIWSAEKVTYKAFTDLQVRLEGEDKKAIANSIYDLLPDVIYFGLVPIPIKVIKAIITRDSFQRIVQDTYNNMSQFVEANQEYLRKQVLEFIPDSYETTFKNEDTDNNPLAT